MRIFISYAHVDKHEVKSLILDNLVAAGHHVWFDDFLIPGQEWQPQLVQAIRSSDILIYAMSTASVESDWCQWEVAQATKSEKAILPIKLHQDTPIPDYLTKIQYVDFSDGVDKKDLKSLLTGLNYIALVDVPAYPSNPKGAPPQASTTVNDRKVNMEDSNSRNLLSIAGFIVAVVGTIATIISLYPIFVSPVVEPTPSIPRITAQQNMDVRNGPGTNFDRIAVLNAGEYLDILGIDGSNRWYQVLLPSGDEEIGWVIAASSAGEVSGSLGALAVIMPTETSTSTLTWTPAVTDTPISTSTEINTPEPTTTITPSPTKTSTSTSIPSPTNTDLPTNTPFVLPTVTLTSTPLPTATSSQCLGTILGVGGLINQVKLLPNPSSPARPPVQRGSTVVLLDTISDFGTNWYQIEYADTSGWIPEEYVDVPSNCP